jgi:hypothetical protein
MKTFTLTILTILTLGVTTPKKETIVIQHVDSKGDTTYTPYDKKNYYNGGCVTSDIDPKYFCKRDKIKF